MSSEDLIAYAQNWMVQTFLITLLTFSVAFLVRKLVNGLLKKANQTKTQWDDAFLSSLASPVSAAIILVGLAFATEPLPNDSGQYLTEVVPLIRELGLIILLAWFLVRFIKRSETIMVTLSDSSASVDETTAAAISKLLRISVIVSAVLIIMQSLGYSVSGVLAFGGIGGIAVGFAAKDLLSNFFGAVMIHLDRPFSVGDWIRSPDKEIEGVVEKISWRLTVIRTFDQRALDVPNSVFTQISVQNPSRMTNRRIYETIGVRYQDASKLPTIVIEVKAMLAQHEELDDELVQIVNFNAFASSSLDFFVYVLTKTTDWIKYHEIKQDVLFKILQIIEANQAEVAFPTSTLHVDSLPQPTSVS